jgi:hypothetical protein
LKLASALDHWATQMDMGRKPDPKSLTRKASAELRRLQAELDALKKTLAEPVQESVAETEIDIYADHCGTVYSEAFLPKGTKLYTTPPATPIQPVGDWVWSWLMDWCKRQGVSPATQDSLFKMVKDSRIKFDK